MLLGEREEKRVFAIAQKSREILVLDEDGTLLDWASVPLAKDEETYHVFHFDGGPIGERRWAITIDTNMGAYLFEVDLKAQQR